MESKTSVYNIGSKTNSTALGLTLRTQREGAETELLRKFIERVQIRTSVRDQVTLFHEPRLESGFPDLVIVVWSLAIAEKWDVSRPVLSPDDFKVLQYMSRKKEVPLQELKEVFGVKVDSNLEKLAAASLIRKRGRFLEAAPVRRSYAVRHIISFEAKIENWRGALQQASLNRWFATSSNILIPKIPSNSQVIPRAHQLNVGVWSLDDSVLDIRNMNTQSTPVSYASWLFNEWAWRTFAGDQEGTTSAAAVMG